MRVLDYCSLSYLVFLASTGNVVSDVVDVVHVLSALAHEGSALVTSREGHPLKASWGLVSYAMDHALDEAHGVCPHCNCHTSSHEPCDQSSIWQKSARDIGTYLPFPALAYYSNDNFKPHEGTDLWPEDWAMQKFSTLDEKPTTDSPGHTPWFVARKADTLVISFRGTYSVADALQDTGLMMAPVDCYDQYPLMPKKQLPECYAHKHMYDLAYQWYDQHHEDLLQKWTKPAEKDQKVSVVVTGHSLGAGIAGLLTFILSVTHPELALSGYGFASPPVITKDASKFLKGKFITVVHNKDVVPRLSHAPLQIMQDRLLEAKSLVKKPADKVYPKLDPMIFEYPLLIPGDVLWFLKDKGNDWKIYDADYIEQFQHLLWAESMLKDHLFAGYEKAIREALEDSSGLREKSFRGGSENS